MSDHQTSIPQTVFVGLAVACVLFTALDWTYEKHPHVRFEGWFNFYGFAAGLATIACIVLAGWARRILGSAASVSGSSAAEDDA